MEGPGEAVGEMNFIIALRTPDCLPDSAPVQRPVDLVGPRVHVCSWGWGAMPGWPYFTHHRFSMPLTCWKILDEDVTCPRFDVNHL